MKNILATTLTAMLLFPATMVTGEENASDQTCMEQGRAVYRKTMNRCKKSLKLQKKAGNAAKKAMAKCEVEALQERDDEYELCSEMSSTDFGGNVDDEPSDLDAEF